jgi:uncharacterized protein
VEDKRVRKAFAAVDAMDWEALASLLHPEVVYERPGFEPLVGRDRVMRFYRVERTITRSVHQFDGVVAQDGQAVAWGNADCELADGTRTTIGFADVFGFAGGLIRHRRTHFFVPAV